MLPRVFTLLRTRFKPPTSCASVCISPSPFCTLSSCSVTSRNDWPIRSLSVFAISRLRSGGFLPTVFRVGDKLALLFVQIGKLFPLQGVERSDPPVESIPEFVHGARQFFPVIPGDDAAFFPVQTKIFPKVFSIRSNERCISSSSRFSSPAMSEWSFRGRKKTCKAMITTSKQIINPSISFYFGSKIEKSYREQ